MSTYTPRAMLQRRMVELLRGDFYLTSTTPPLGLLFPAWAPQLSAADERIYGQDAYLPPDVAEREQLPRILVQTQGAVAGWEQDTPNVLNGPVAVVLRVLVPKDRESLGEAIAAYLPRLILSTPISDARIIAAGLVDEGTDDKATVPAFNDAWEFVSRYRSANVGVLQ